MTYGAGNPHNGLGEAQQFCKVFLTDKVLPKLFFSFYWNSIDIFFWAKVELRTMYN